MTGSGRILVWIGGGLILGMVALAGWIWHALTTPLDAATDEPTLVRIESGSSVTAIAAQLDDQMLIASPLLFRGYVEARQLSLKSGLYHVAPADSIIEIADLLASGRVSEVQVTIPERLGFNAGGKPLAWVDLFDPVAFLEAAHYNPTLVELPGQFNLRADTFLEGLLFPDTYRFAVGSSASDLIATMLATLLGKIAALPQVDYETMILASIVEREAKFSEDRAMIAGVYANRLALGMKLDADPTVQYAKANILNGCSDDATGCATAYPAEAGEVWWPTISTLDYQSVDSPYNTYRTAGLPPRPIAAPGLAAIEAAAAPAEHDFLYFLSDAQGHAHFAKTIAEHQRNKLEFLK